MDLVTLGKTGLRVSRPGFGGIPIQRISEAEAVGVIRAALDLGVNFVDTAIGYGDSQAKIGAAIRGLPRDRLVIASKSGRGDREGMLRDIETCLADLGCGYIDLFQLHGVSSRDKWEQCRGDGGALSGLLEARDRGWIRHIGFTSHSLDMALALIEEPVFETVQFPFNLVTREPADGLIPRCRELGLGFIVMKPLCGGQYDNARFAFRFLNGYPDLVPIPGIETGDQIREIATLIEEGTGLEGDELREAEAVAERLGKLFCRRCGYCQPCPHGVPITQAMIFTSFVARLPGRKLLDGPVKQIIETVPNCTECGECEAKCPYDLAIRKVIHESLELARSLAAGN